eukprot:2559237-Pyramimonas_sp.AAC.1
MRSASMAYLTRAWFQRGEYCRFAGPSETGARGVNSLFARPQLKSWHRAFTPPLFPSRVGKSGLLTKRESVATSTALPARLTACAAAVSSARCAVCSTSTSPRRLWRPAPCFSTATPACPGEDGVNGMRAAAVRPNARA